jgi:hypothetical protein
MRNYIAGNINSDLYLGTNGIRQAIADQQSGINVQKLTIALANEGTHAILVTGASWYRLADALQRPNNEYIKVHDPAVGGQNRVIAIGEW